MTKAAASRRRAALTARPWFPGALGLWFAALFGLSTLALPPETLERAMAAIGIDRMFAAAAPPLGETARLLIVAAVGTIGEIFGLLLGYALARRHRDAATGPVEVAVETAPEDIVRPAFEHEPRRPLSAAELVGTGLEDTSPDEPEPPEEVEDRELAEPVEAVAWTPSEPAAPPVYVPPPPFVAPAPPSERVTRDEAFEPAPPPQAPSPPPLAAAPLDGLGSPQLTERLAMALAARKERGDGVPGNRLGALAGLERARLGGWSEDASGEAEEEIEEDEQPGDESGYSSLLDIGRHHLRHASEMSDVDEDEDDEDIVGFPGSAQHVEDESNASLSTPHRFTGSR